MHLPTVITVLCIMGTLSCSATNETRIKKSRYSRGYIYSEEINEGKAANAYDLIRNLRPQWLRSFGINSISYPNVYVDGFRGGDIHALSTIATQHIVEIQFFNSSEAFIRFGPDHPGGAILVTTN